MRRETLDEANRVASKLDHAIMTTPTSDLRNVLCDAKIIIMALVGESGQS